MVNYLFFLASLLVALPSYSKTFSYRLSVKCPPQVNIKGTLCYYKGAPYDLAEQWCLIQDVSQIVVASIVIAPTMEWRTTGNNVRYLQRKPEEKCLWYDIKLQITEDGYSWIIEKQDLDKVPLRLPEHTFYIQLDPDLVEDIYDEPQLRSASQNTVIYLPVIKLKKEITSDLFQELMDYPLAASFDIKTVHRERRKIINNTENPLIISMITVK